jgi:hypothetical protein
VKTILWVLVHDHDVRVTDEVLVRGRPGVSDRDLEAAPRVAMLVAQAELQVVDQRIGGHPVQPLHQAAPEAHSAGAARTQDLDLFMLCEIE